MRKEIIQGNYAVVISQNADGGSFFANLFVNVRDGVRFADITVTKGKFKTLAGAERWASKTLSEC